ncbi:MAG: hypothetical protein KAS72_10920 [Phycisphaerales bacterium]|nr:hypothetical protein [Phycisphaerales bacterium]
MPRLILSILLTLAIIYIVPFLIYGLFSVLTDLKPPQDASAARFLLSVLVSKIGTAVAFVVIFHMARESLSGHWLLYAGAWWIMFVVGECGQAILPTYSWTEAIAGIISETIYFPLAALTTNLLLHAQ